MGLGIHTATVLKDIIRRSRRFYYLDIRKNLLGDAGIGEIAPAIQKTASLVHLDVSSNDISAKGGTILFKALMTNKSITSLDISSHEGLHRNHLGEAGMKTLASVLMNNKYLSMLDISGNSIKTEGLGTISEGLYKNTSLLSLKVAQNDILGTLQCVQYLKSMVIFSKIIELDISSNPLGNACVEAFGIVLGNAGMPLRKLYCTNVDINRITNYE